MFGENKDCPIRITCCVGTSRKQVEEISNELIKQFGWKHHSWQALKTKIFEVHSRILFNNRV